MKASRKAALPPRHLDWSGHEEEAERLPRYLRKAHEDLCGELRAFRKTHPDWFYGYETGLDLGEGDLRCWAVACRKYGDLYHPDRGNMPAHMAVSFWKKAAGYAGKGVPLVPAELDIPAEFMRRFLAAHPQLACETQKEDWKVTYRLLRG